MSSCGGGDIGVYADPDGRTTDVLFLNLGRFFILDILLVPVDFVDPDFLETNDIYGCEADLDIKVSKLYHMLGYYN